jgi:hypothetical protein
MSHFIAVVTAKFEQQYSQTERKEQTRSHFKGKTERNRETETEKERMRAPVQSV